MSKSQTIKVTIKNAHERLDVFLSKKLDIPRAQVTKMIKADQVFVNKQLPKKTGELTHAGDAIKIIPLKPIAKGKTSIRKIFIKTPEPVVLTETSDYLIVDKPWGLLTHNVMGKDETSLAEILAKKYPEIKTVGDKPEQRPGIVHRLDKEASGLIVVARTQKMFNHLKKQFKAHTINKEYLALAHGRIDRDCDEINFPITRSKNTERMSAIPSIIKGLPTTDGKLAATEFEVVKRFVNFTLLKVKIHTGRTHQIRVHLFAYNHPLVGDPLYFSKKQKRKYDDLLGRLFLHSAELSFIDLQKQEQTFKIDLPDRLKKFLNEIV